jgi:hypothetical protein
VVDPDYCSLKFTFDKFTEGFISRLLFIKKKFSPEINKKFLERVIRKRKILAEEQISQSDLDKMFGNHLFKFFYKVMNNYARSHKRLSPELSLYLGLTDEHHSNSDQEPGAEEVFDSEALLEAYTSVLEKDKAYFIYEYLQFFMVNKNNGYNLFSIFKDIFSCNLNEINEVRTLLKYYKMVIRTNKSSSLKQYETNLYKIQNDLEKRITFSESEKTAQKQMLDSLRREHRMPDITKKFRKMSEFKQFVMKQKLNEVVLPTVMLKVVNTVKVMKNEVLSQIGGEQLDVAKMNQIIAENQIVKECGLSDLIETLVQ